MEADWSVEMGADEPRIVVPWGDSGLSFVDLRLTPDAAESLEETRRYPALAEALRNLNAPFSRVFTSKCDVWDLAIEEIDPYEMEATTRDAGVGIACYIDVIRRGEAALSPFAEQEAFLRRTISLLRAVAAPCARAEFVLRRAVLKVDSPEVVDGFGLTLYVKGCGADGEMAERNWAVALGAAVSVLVTAA